MTAEKTEGEKDERGQMEQFVRNLLKVRTSFLKKMNDPRLIIFSRMKDSKLIMSNLSLINFI